MHEEIKPIYLYKEAGGAVSLFNELLRAALNYKYKDFLKTGLIVPVGPQIITESIFGLNNHDLVQFQSHIISGERLQELFVASILLKRLEPRFAGRVIGVALPSEKNQYDDVFIFAVNPSNVTVIKRSGQSAWRLHDGTDDFVLPIQIKAPCVPQRPIDKARLILPTAHHKQLDEIEQRLFSYTGSMVIVFSRFFGLVGSEELDPLLSHENVVYICMPAKDVEIMDSKEGVYRIPLIRSGDCYNFLMCYQGGPPFMEAIPVPDFLLPRK